MWLKSCRILSKCCGQRGEESDGNDKKDVLWLIAIMSLSSYKIFTSAIYLSFSVLYIFTSISLLHSEYRHSSIHYHSRSMDTFKVLLQSSTQYKIQVTVQKEKGPAWKRSPFLAFEYSIHQELFLIFSFRFLSES